MIRLFTFMLCGAACTASMAEVQQACVMEMKGQSSMLVDKINAVSGSWGLTQAEAKQAAVVFNASFLFTATKAFEVFAEDDSTYVTTGDIGWMWLRDSCYELLPYLSALEGNPQQFPNTGLVIESAMHRMVSFINTDIYGSAFVDSASVGPTKHECPPSKNCPSCTCTQCAPTCGDYTFQRDFELDSVLHVLLFHYQYYSATNRTSHVQKPAFKTALGSIISLLQIEMYHNSKSPYVFDKPEGCKVKDGIGLVWSFARPSDDPTSGGYSIPDNIMLVVVIKKLVTLLQASGGFQSEIAQIETIAATVEAAIEKYGVMSNGEQKIYAYEADGYGKQTALDDANLPNLLWLPYLGYADHLQLYNNTRAFVLSNKDENYFKGSFATGLGSQHHSFGLRSHNPGPQCTGNCIWHLGLIMEGLTSPSRDVKRVKLHQILTTLAGQELLHEGFAPGDPTKYNRDWFGWADAMYCMMIIKDWIPYGHQ